MRIMLQVKFPHKPFNAAVKDGSVGAKIRRILEDAKPEAAYFTEIDGRRCGIVVVEVDEPSQIPVYAEPWFLMFEADIEFHPAMTPDDLGAVDFAALAKKWS